MRDDAPPRSPPPSAASVARTLSRARRTCEDTERVLEVTRRVLRETRRVVARLPRKEE